VPLWRRGAGSPSNRVWPGPRPTCTPIFILIHPAIWPQYTNNTPTLQTGQGRTDRQTGETDRQRPGHTALDGDPAPPPPKGHCAQLSAHICYGQRAGWIKMPLGMQVGLGPGDFMLGIQLPSPKRRKSPPQFSAHVYCGLTAGWIKMALGMEVRLGPGHFVLDRDPAPLLKMGQRPQFSAHFYCGQTVAHLSYC